MELSKLQEEWLSRVYRNETNGDCLVVGWPDEEFGVSEENYQDYLLDQYSEYLEECKENGDEPSDFEWFKCECLSYGEWAGAEMEEQGEDPGFEEFSRDECECCGSHLAGARHAATILHLERKEEDGSVPYTPLSVCSDCLVYIANGDVPDDEYLTWLED